MPDPSPTYFTPTPGTYTLTGAVTVNQALQDPFSNLLQRGALHNQPVSLDVTMTPDAPFTAGQETPILLGTCKCSQRGSGLRLTVEPPGAVSDAGGGQLRIQGMFTSEVTAADAITLRRTS